MLWITLGIAAVIAVAIVGVKGAALGLIYRLIQLGGAILVVVLLGWFFTYVMPFLVAAALWVILLGGLVLFFVYALAPSNN